MTLSLSLSHFPSHFRFSSQTCSIFRVIRAIFFFCFSCIFYHHFISFLVGKRPPTSLHLLAEHRHFRLPTVSFSTSTCSTRLSRFAGTCTCFGSCPSLPPTYHHYYYDHTTPAPTLLPLQPICLYLN